jgi:hypothetical protein
MEQLSSDISPADASGLAPREPVDRIERATSAW